MRVERLNLFQKSGKGISASQRGRPGPVLVSVPMDIFSMRVDVKLFERLKNYTKKLQ